MSLTRQFKGLLPALDRRQPTDKFVLDGQNFLVDAKGPYSAFGSIHPTHTVLRNPLNAATFRIANEIVLFTSDTVLKFNTVSQLYYPVFIFPLNTTDFPWSQSVVGGIHYFVKKNSDLISYNPLTDKWITITTNVITTPHAIAKAGGRLIIVGIDDVQWSAIDNGTDLGTDIEKGVGIQSLAIVGGGTPFAILATFDGFITYTSTGSMKSELVDSINPFRHFPLTGDKGMIPLSQYTVIETANNEHVMLTKTGFYVTVGKVPEPFQPLMGEYFRREILPKFDLTNISIIRLTFNSDRQWFIVSVAESEIAFNYTFAYVLYIPRDEWGIFNHNHVGFGELSISEGSLKGFNFGHFDAEGLLHKFLDFPYVEAHLNEADHTRLPGNFHHYHTPFTPPIRSEDGFFICGTVGQLETYDEEFFTSFGSNLFEYTEIGSFPSPATPDDIQQDSTSTSFIDDLSAQSSLVEIGWRQYTPIFESIDSFIEIGLYRVQTEEDKTDEFTLVTDVTIGMLESPSGQEFVDWLIFLPNVEEDWLNDDLEPEDWGVGIFSGTDYIAKIIGSLDGENQFQDQQETLEERTDIVNADLDETTGKVRYFTCYNNGIYHIIRIEALNVDESFHLRVTEMAPIPAGRM